MRKLLASWRIVPAVFFLIVILVTACSGKALPWDTRVGAFESCTGFIDPGMIEEKTGILGLSERVQILDIGGIPGLAESGAVNNCLIEVFRAIDGKNDPAPGESLMASIVQFETPEQVLLLYNSTLASALITTEQLGDLGEIRQEVIGSDSYLMDVRTGGVGAIVVFAADSIFVSMSATVDSQGRGLVNSKELLQVAQDMQSRLP